MNAENTIRAWKDPYYRATLSPEERASMPEHPAGLVELSDAELENASGGFLILSIIFGSCDIFCTGSKYCTKAGPKC